jgi:hypothetical protein
VLTQALLAAGGLFPLGVMLVLLFAAVWIHDERRERENSASRSRL